MKTLRALCILLFVHCTFPITLNALELLSPKNNVYVSGNLLSFAWERSLALAPSYNLVVSKNPDLSLPIVNILVGSSSAAVPFTGISGSTYYWKVSDKKLGVESPISSFIFIIPDSIGQMAAWYKPESGFTLNGVKVSKWTNAVTGGLDFSQSTAALQPTLISQDSLINNNKCVLFSGSPANYLQSTSSVALTRFSAYCVRTYENYNPSLQYFLGGTTQGLFSEGDALNAGFGSFNGSLIYSSVSALVPQYAIYLHSNTKLKINNLVPQLASNSSLSSFTFNTLGARPDALTFAFKGKMAELIIFKTELDNTQDQVVYNYLADKFAPPVNLGQDTILGSSFCDSVTISAGNRFLTYLWGGGQTTSSIKVLPNRNYTVTTKDVFGRFSSDNINVYPYRRLSNATIYICKGDTFNLDLKTPPGFSAIWNTGATSTNLSISNAGQYTVKVIDNAGCFVFDTINVIVDEPKLLPSPDSLASIKLCKNEKLFLTTTTSFDSIRWSTGSTANFITLVDSGSYSVSGTTKVGCVIHETFNVNIAGEAPMADFIPPGICQNTLVAFTDNSMAQGNGIINSWKWTFGDGNIAFQQNPNNTYSNIGSYSIGLKITTDQGCTDSISKTIYVNRLPKAKFDNRLSCAAAITNFQDLSDANATSIADWNWDFSGLGTINSIQNPSFVFPVEGVYNVTLKIKNSNQCEDTVTNAVTVNPSPVANFSFDSICGRNDVHFKWLSTVAPPADIQVWNWDFGDGAFNSAIKDVAHAYDTPGEYDVTLTVRSTNVCSDTAVRRIKVFEYPTVDFDVSQTQCVGKEIQFTDISTSPDNSTPVSRWNWYFSGQATSTEQNPRYTFSSEGNYTIQLTAANAIGCSETKLRSIAVSLPPIPKFSFSPENGSPPLTVNYTNQSTAIGNYFWDYGDNSGPLVQAFTPPPHIYTTRGSYPIKLIATDFRGCTDTLTKYILVDKAYLDGVLATITITPNGDYYSVQAVILNNSNIEIRALGLSLQLGGGSVVRENWEGSLLPGQSVSYTFASQIRLSDISIPVICATIENINNYAPEDVLDNNTACKETNVGTFDVLNIYPNPAYEKINFGVMLPKEGNVSVEFVDYLGRSLYKEDFTGAKGYNNFSASTAILNASVYVAVIKYDGDIIRKKFVCRGTGN